MIVEFLVRVRHYAINVVNAIHKDSNVRYI